MTASLKNINLLFPLYYGMPLGGGYCNIGGSFFMAIIKSKHASNYTVLPNEIFKSGLTLEAIGLLSYLLSLPHDWVIYKTQLHSQLGIGREKLNSAFESLAEKGYIISVRKHGENGKIEYEHIVYDKPYNAEPQTGQPYTGKPSTVKPSTVNPQLQSTNITKEINTKEIITKSYQLAVDFWLKEFHVGWEFNGMHGKNLKQLLNKLAKLLPNIKSEQDVVGIFSHFCSKLPDWYKDKDIPTLNTKFNEIIEQIKNQKNESTRKTKSKYGYGNSQPNV